MDQHEMPPLEPLLAALLAPLPLPIALLRRDGTILGTTHCFDREYALETLRSAELRAHLIDEPPHWVSITATLADGTRREAGIYVTTFRDDAMVLFADRGAPVEAAPRVAELEQRVSELERLVATDPLTGAWNRAHLDRIMAIELGRSARHHQPLSVILLDIDRFKQVNDTHGHAAGDAALRELVRIVQARIRPGDMLFRWGGEEFLVLVPATSYTQARTVAEKVRTSVAASELPGAGRITVSCGIAERLPGESAEALFGRVDRALYAAKAGGRNRTVTDARGCSDGWESSLLRLTWSDEYACGNAVIDAQHRNLFALANRLIDASLRDTVSPQEVKEALGHLVGEVQQHFADEEAILEGMNYIRTAQHRRAHQSLLKRAAQMRALADNGMLSFGAMVDFLVHDVVARHMLAMDREYFPLFRERARPAPSDPG